MTALSGPVEVSSSSQGTIQALAFAGALAVSGGTNALAAAGAGATTDDSIRRTIESLIENTLGVPDAEATSAAYVTVTTSDQPTITSNADAGAVSVAGGVVSSGVSVGAVTSTNTINDTVTANIDDATVTADASDAANGDGAVNVEATEDATINATPVAAAVAASAGSSFAGGGASADNRVTNTIEASITGGSIVTASQGVDVNAMDTPTVTAKIVAVTLAVGSTARRSGPRRRATRSPIRSRPMPTARR